MEASFQGNLESSNKCIILRILNIDIEVTIEKIITNTSLTEIAFVKKPTLPCRAQIDITITNKCNHFFRSSCSELPENYEGPEIFIVNNWTEYYKIPANWILHRCSCKSEYDDNDSCPHDGVKYTIDCTIKWLGFTMDTNQNNFPQIYEGTKKLLDNPKLTDLVLAVGEDRFPVHKIILASQSPVFMNMFTNDMEENATDLLTIEHFDAKTMKLVLQYFYEGHLEELNSMECDVIINVFRVAHEYNIHHLKNICQFHLLQNITFKNVSDILELAYVCDLEALKHEAQTFVKLNKNKVVKKEKFQNLCMKIPQVLLELFKLL